MILCPICDSDNVHFCDPEILDGKDNHEAWQGRGDAIKIPMYCESDHEWNLVFGHHKGNTFIFCEEIETKYRTLPMNIKNL